MQETGPIGAAAHKDDDPRRAAVKRLLDAHRPSDEKERADLVVMRRAITLDPDPFSRHTFPDHFTASAVIVDPAGEHVLLVHHRRLDRWLQPGGHFEIEDTDAVAAALREAREETGLTVRPHAGNVGLLDVDAHPIPTNGKEPDHVHLDLRFLVEADLTTRVVAQAEETKEARWFTWEEVDVMGFEGELARLMAKARDRST